MKKPRKKPAAAKAEALPPKPADYSQQTAQLEPFRWKPGQSGNPNGRPRVIGELRDLARAYTMEALETLASVMRDAEAPPAARVAAVAHILDRGYGKPTQHVSATVRDLREMTDAELFSYLTDETGGGEGGFAAQGDQDIAN